MRPDQLEQDPDERGLAGAVRAEQGHHLARANLEVDGVQRHGRSKTARDTGELSGKGGNHALKDARSAADASVTGLTFWG
jgi:hypothetical protein